MHVFFTIFFSMEFMLRVNSVFYNYPTIFILLRRISFKVENNLIYFRLKLI